MKDVKKISASRRRKLLIIFSAVAVVVLAIAIAYVMDYVKTITYEDPADNAKYYICYSENIAKRDFSACGTCPHRSHVPRDFS